jgi:V-type H+-transporting ATPase subunit a
MGTLFRSQDMQLVQLFVQIEAAHDTVDELGKLGLIEFRDVSTVCL